MTPVLQPGSAGANPRGCVSESALRAGIGTATLDILPEQKEDGVLAYYQDGETGSVSKHELPARFVCAIATIATDVVPAWNTPYWAHQ